MEHTDFAEWLLAIWFPHGHGYIFSGVVFLIEFSNEQHISVRNIDGCYFLAVKEQTFLMLKLKLVRFALTASTQYSHAVCAARNAQQACSHNCLGTHFISMHTFWYTPPHAGFVLECGLDF